MAARPRRFDELRGEPLHPAVDGDVVHGDAALGQQLLGVAVGEVIAQVPEDRDGDHLRGNRKPANTEEERGDVTAPVSCLPRSANATPPGQLSQPLTVTLTQDQCRSYRHAPLSRSTERKTSFNTRH